MTNIFEWVRDTVVAAAMAVGALFGTADEGPTSYQGYVEGEYVRIGAATGGTIDTLNVRRGDTVNDGDVVFILEQERETAALREAAARLAEARAAYENLRSGLRDPEIAVLQAQREQAEADLVLSESELRRVQQLMRANVAAAQRLDAAEAAVARNQARVEELRARIQSGQMAARSDEIAGARARIAAATAAMTQAEWQVSQRSGVSTVTGLVTDTMFRAGEQVQPGQPVIEILPPENLIVRFFVPESALASITPTRQVWLQWGAPVHTVMASVSYVAPQAEFTPPVIYSENARGKLVFLVEARPASVDGLNPGQPLDVTLEEPAQ
ncbi:MAG: HlyD family efflux transporter periplasmic adaptor subunit [Proteobacteria bacterium]|nr:HlyD family efflux transporter periplasmic adaptor subunit [Pseudomonadota bacterium]MDA1057331.1 HlyD family efflux transporter periplasmic adaptor subunit [Pseudomonadota bacterium]